MLYKKLISLIGAGAMLFSVVTPAFGAWNITINKAKIKSTTTVEANSGANWIGNNVSVKKAYIIGGVEVKGDNNVTTGKTKAESRKVIVANTNIGCDTCETSSLIINNAKIKNSTTVSANSGANMVGNSVEVKKAGIDGKVEVRGNNTLTTGKTKAENRELIVVNTQISL